MLRQHALPLQAHLVLETNPLFQDHPALEKTLGLEHGRMQRVAFLFVLERENTMTYPQGTGMVLFCLSLIFFAVPAYAYGDPNTVGLISQVLTPLLIMAGACVTFLRKSILSAFDRMRRRLRGRAKV